MTRSPAHTAAERPFAHLAEHLIALRRAARLPQRALAQAASISRGTVQRAESGTAAPTPAVLDAYIRACGGHQDDLTRARRLRNRGRTAQRDRLRHLHAPAPALVHTTDDFGAALAAAYEHAGAPPLTDARLTPGRTPLPRTTAWRIVNRRKLPPTTEQLVTFLTACGITPAQQRPYLAAYHRIITDLAQRPAPPPRRQITTHIHRTPLARGGTDTSDYTTKISQPFRTLLTTLSPEDIETVLTAGTAHLIEQRGRLNGTAPAAPEWLATTNLIAPTYALEAHRETALTDDWHQREAFLHACGVPDRNMHLWHQAWNRAAGTAPPGRDTSPSIHPSGTHHPTG
ncbi:helix-turn-helix transcriptional regulator [Streptomyces sp. NPDC006668]|uniref:helix-turn-helix domain-containing protein n=1 Tax=Streptomyces sp. NPDC006668 TaxID=3156903 RepID=UPI0034097F8A